MTTRSPPAPAPRASRRTIPSTRGQAAAFLWRIEGRPTGAPAHPFEDVVAVWQQEPVSWMYAEGITTGTTATTYAPDDTLTRGQMAALLWRAAGRPDAAPTTFPDVIKAWQFVPVGWMEAENITTGTSPTEFSPADPVTRGQFATFAWRWQDPPPVVVDEYTPLCNGIDHFDGTLQAGWTWFEADGSYRSFDDHPGYVAMAGPDDGVIGLDRGRVAEDYLIETKMRFRPAGNFAVAGLQAGNGPDGVVIVRDHCVLAGCAGDAVYLSNFIDGDWVERIYFPIPAAPGDLYLRLWHVDGLWIGAFSFDGTTWDEVGRVTNHMDDETYGVYTGFSQTDPSPIALFDWFAELPL